MLEKYRNWRTGGLPEKYNLFDMHTIEKPILLYGHFNKLKNFGVEDYYPEVKQFITILRDPIELVVSTYFFARMKHLEREDQTQWSQGKLKEYLLTGKPNMLNHFPREMNINNYKEIIEEYFIDIGITEYLDESMKRIAIKLNLPYYSAFLSHENATDRDQKIPYELRDIFIEKNQLEFAVYDYALKKHTQQSASSDGNSSAPPITADASDR